MICRDWDGVFTPNDSDWYLNAEHALNDGWHPTESEIIRLAENGDIEEWER